MAFKVDIDTSGQQFECQDNETILEAAVREGIELPYGCRSGACGSCKGKLLEGKTGYPEGEPGGITDEEIDAGYVLCCQAVPSSDIRLDIEVIENDAEIKPVISPCKVHKIDRLNHDVVRMLVKLPADERLPFRAGQYIDFMLKDGRKRAFSLANAPHDDQYLEFHIRHVDGGDFTSYIFNDLKENALLRFEGPLGSFFFREDNPKPIIMMGGGTGFAPLKGIIEHAFNENIKQPIHLFWGARSLNDLYLNELPESWQAKYENFTYSPVLSDPISDDNWQGLTGWVHEAVVNHYPDLSAYQIYMCGPPPMIKSARATFIEKGLDEKDLYYDSFDFAVDKK